jgi:Secretion system C-terminal sorting domain
MKSLNRILILVVCVAATLAVAQEKAEPSKGDLSKQVKVFPNPAVEFLTVKFETAQAAKSTAAIRNIIGNEMAVESEVVDEYEIRLKVKDLPTGFYFLLIRNENTGLKEAYKFLKR